MKPIFDYRESTITYDYETKTVEFYFTRKSNYDTCCARNPHYLKAEDLKPGYRIVYPFQQMRTPEFLIRVPRSEETSSKGQKEPQNASKTTQEASK